MNLHVTDPPAGYGIDIQPLEGRVSAYRNDELIASSTGARVMYETRLKPTIYFPIQDVTAKLGERTALQTFCPFKGTASYRDLVTLDARVPQAVWSYEHPLPESRGIQGFVGFGADAVTRFDLGQNRMREDQSGNISGPVIDWLLRQAAVLSSAEALTAALAEKLSESGVVLSRLSVMIWSLHPMIAGKNYIWDKKGGKVTTYAPSYEIHDHPSFVNSPLRHVSSGLGGIRQKIGEDYADNSFPIIEDLRAAGATDYVAMPMPFSDGRTNVLTLTSDHPDGFTTANLGLVFECSAAISRFYEVFMQRENAQSLLETYVGKRTGARVLGGEIRRGDGDEIDAAIMFCDMRDSTQLEERLGRAEYISVLNHFFETTSQMVHAHGGEVLKFIGDAVLAVFPGAEGASDACERALAASRAVVAQLAEAQGDTACRCAIGLAYGRVTYGNVGSQERLDFTVIGKPANIAARLCDYGKICNSEIVFTEEIAGDATDVVELGHIDLHNVKAPVRAFSH